MRYYRMKFFKLFDIFLYFHPVYWTNSKMSLNFIVFLTWIELRFFPLNITEIKFRFSKKSVFYKISGIN